MTDAERGAVMALVCYCESAKKAQRVELLRLAGNVRAALAPVTGVAKPKVVESFPVVAEAENGEDFED